MTSPTLTDLLAEAKALLGKAPLPMGYEDGGEHRCPKLLLQPHPRFCPDDMRYLIVNLSPASVGENENLARLILCAVNALPQLLAWEKLARELTDGLFAVHPNRPEAYILHAVAQQLLALLGPAAGEG